MIEAAVVERALNRSTSYMSWRGGLPDLLGRGIWLREPRLSDAEGIASLKNAGTVWPFTDHQPSSQISWVRAIQRFQQERAAGRCVTYVAIDPETSAVNGLIVIRRLELDFRIGEFVFMFSDSSWSTELPAASLQMAFDFAFRDIGVHRLEGRSLTKLEARVLGAVGCSPEGVLRDAAVVKGTLTNQTLWALLEEEWTPLASSACRRRHPCGSSFEPPDRDIFDDAVDQRPAWSTSVPVLKGSRATLREIEPRDGDALLRYLSPKDIAASIEPPPTTSEMFQQYIAWAKRQRITGRAISFAIFADGGTDPVGLLQIRCVDQDFRVAEWGVVLTAPHRGTGLFADVVRLSSAFVFGTLGVRRLEARTSTSNRAAIASLKQMGAVKEASIRGSFLKGDDYLDDELWTLLDRDLRSEAASATA